MITRDELVRELKRAEEFEKFMQTNSSCFGGSIDACLLASERHMRAREALRIYDSALEECAREFEMLLKDTVQSASDEYIEGRGMGITLCLNVIKRMRGEK